MHICDELTLAKYQDAEDVESATTRPLMKPDPYNFLNNLICCTNVYELTFYLESFLTLSFFLTSGYLGVSFF